VSESTQIADGKRFAAALQRFDEENARDPNHEIVNGTPRPRELVYSEWLTGWVLRLSPNASEPLQLAARCQHLCRWMIPRNTFPLTKGGYLQWRHKLKQFHAERSAEILRAAGYPDDIVQRVHALNLKKDLATDHETQVLEDALCLVFLEHQLTDLANRSTEEKVVNALKKSWAKMSEAGRARALELNYAPREKDLLARALAGT